MTEKNGDIEAPDVYTNTVSITYNVYDFIFDFGLESPSGSPELGDTKRRVARIRMSPQHAKSIIYVLENVVERYENRLCEITLPEGLIERMKGQNLEGDDDAGNS